MRRLCATTLARVGGRNQIHVASAHGRHMAARPPWSRPHMDICGEETRQKTMLRLLLPMVNAGEQWRWQDPQRVHPRRSGPLPRRRRLTEREREGQASATTTTLTSNRLRGGSRMAGRYRVVDELREPCACFEKRGDAGREAERRLCCALQVAAQQKIAESKLGQLPARADPSSSISCAQSSPSQRTRSKKRRSATNAPCVLVVRCHRRSACTHEQAAVPRQ